MTNTAPFNATGAPAVSIPCGEVDGRPVGLQLVGPPGADGFLLRVAASVERALTQPSQSTNTA
ncbi:amidase family protein [Halolamina pelagica]|uniref:amidase family protein n=1 Tax=Halolamina pelagica TaxID=699431 RepID=UPI0019559715|nr:amidase family protein [Halolamina pelagica]